MERNIKLKIMKVKFQVEMDFKSFFFELLQMVLKETVPEVDTTSTVGTAEPSISILKIILNSAISLSKNTSFKSAPERKAWLLINNTTKRAVLHFVDKYDTFPRLRKLKTEVKRIPNEREVRDLLFDRDFIYTPSFSSICTELKRSFLNCFLQNEAFEDIYNTINREWETCFSIALENEWGSKDYSELLDVTDSPTKEHVDFLQNKRVYLSKVQSKISENVFGEEEIQLDKIYKNLGAIVRQGEGIGQTEKNAPTVLYSEDYLLEWCRSNKTGLHIVQGEPGSGKSTLLKKIAYELVDEGFSIVYIELYLLDFEGVQDPMKVFDIYLEKLGWFFGLKENESKKLVIIIDGLDEIVYNVQNTAGTLIRQLKKSTYFLENKLILSGRSGIMKHCEDDIGRSKYLEVLPLWNSRLNIENSLNNTYVDEHRILRKDFRLLYWNKITSLYGMELEYREILDKNIVDITDTPLLLFMLAFTLKNNPSSIDTIASPNKLYREMVLCAYRRSHGREEVHWYERKSEFDSYITILRAIGLVAQKRNSRQVTFSDIKTYCKQIGIQNEFSNWFEKEENIKTSKLFLLFFARKSEDGDESEFEFLHKSFYEFFAVEEVMHRLTHLINFEDDFDYNADQILAALYYVLGSSMFESDGFSFFLENDMENNHKALLLLSKNIGEIKDIFLNADYDFSFKKEIDKISDRGEKGAVVPIYAESYKKATGVIETIEFNFWNLVSVLLHYAYEYELEEPVTYLTFEGMIIEDTIIKAFKLSKIDYSHANFMDCVYAGCTFTGNIYREANITETIFSGSEIIGCDFTGATLSFTHFEGCIFDKNCSLKVEQMDNVCFRGSFFYESSFEGAKVARSDFSNSLLIGINFSKVQFSECDFQFCTLDNIELDTETLFKDCSFSGSELKNIKISMFNLEDEGIVKMLSEADCTKADWTAVDKRIRDRILANSL